MATRTNPFSDSISDLLAKTENERLARIADAWDAYRGDHPETLKTRQGGPNDNLPVNLCRVIVDKGVSYLFGDDVRFEILGSDRDENGNAQNPEARAEDYLEAVFRRNGKQSLLKQFGVNGAVAGHAFLKIKPAALADGSPRLLLLDPSHVTVSWEPDDYLDVWRYRIQYVVEGRDGRPRLFRQTIERDEGRQFWQITDEESESVMQGLVDAGSFAGITTTDWTMTAQEIWPYPFAPIVAAQNLPSPNEYYGNSDLEPDIVRLNYGMNALVSNAMKIIRLHAHPRTIAKGLTAEQAANLPNDPGKLLALPRPESEIKNLEMQSDLSSSIVLFDRLRETLHEVTRIPEVAVGRLDSVGALSGVALQILYAPLVEKTEDKRLTYGAAIVDLCRRLLVLGGMEDYEVSLHWAEVVPDDPEAEARTASLLSQIGVSKNTLLERLGFDPDLEAIKRQEESEESLARASAFFDRGAAAGEEE